MADSDLHKLVPRGLPEPRPIELPERVPLNDRGQEDSWERELQKRRKPGIEYLIAYDQYGQPKTAKQGIAHGVQLSPEELEALRGLAVIHSHDLNGSLSGLDIYTAAKQGLRSMVASDGRYIYTAQPEGAWPDADEARRWYETMFNETMVNRRDRGTGWTDASHELMQRLAKVMKFKYDRRERVGFGR